MKEQYQKLPEKIKGSIELALFITTLGLIFYGIDTGYDSQNNLSEVKSNQLTAPPASEQCNPNDQLDMACWNQITREICDGNMTLDRSDDICETIEYWNYKPAMNFMR